MTEEQIIAKLKKLKQIKPDQDWVYLTKTEVFGAERPKFNESGRATFAKVARSLFNEIVKEERFVLSHKLVFSGLGVFIALIGVFGFALSSVPGDALFQIKKLTEQSQSFFVSTENQPKYNLDLASKRLDDLTEIAENNEKDHLASAINEYQESVTKTAESLINIDNSYIIEELTNDLQELEKKENQVKSLGIEIGQNEELDNVLARMVKKEILEMEEAGLTDEDLEVLNSIKIEYEQGNYSKALELLLLK